MMQGLDGQNDVIALGSTLQLVNIADLKTEDGIQPHGYCVLACGINALR